MGRNRTKALTTEEKETIKVMVASGETYFSISKQISRDPKTVKKYALTPDVADEIAEKKNELADLFEDLAKRMLTSITPEDIKNINAYQRTLSAAVATDKAKLLKEQGSVTINNLVEFVLKLENKVNPRTIEAQVIDS